MNSWALSGHLGHDPKLRHLPGGKAVLNLSVAVRERVYVDGQWKDDTLWVDVTLFGQRAEGLAKLLSTGMKVSARGRARKREFKSREGDKKWALELIADDVELEEAPKPSGERPSAGQGGGTYRAKHRDDFADRGGPDFGDDDSIPF